MSCYLEHIRIDRYGAFTEYDVGPFGPGLNMVYGPNEAGKSTISSFIGGVMFGWDEARGVRNTYRPAEGERSGTLEFRDRVSGEKSSLFRRLNEDGLSGNSSIVADIDHATYRTMFSLSSDELRSLSNSSDVTARLLTAGSGTGSSPSAAFVELEQRIAAKTARSDDADESIVRLIQLSEDKRAEIEKAQEANELRKQEGREMAELVESRALASARLDELNEQVENLHAARARIEELDALASRQKTEIDALKAERLEHAATRAIETSVSPQIIGLNVSEERLLRDKLEEYADEQEKLQRALDAAKENSASSSAAYEALLEMDEDAAVQERSLKNRTTQIVISVLLTLAFIICGIPLFIHGRTIHSLSFTALGIGLVVLACFMAAAALAVLLRPNKGAEALENRRKDAQWIMLQDKKKLDASLAAKDQLEREIATYFESSGLGAAGSSVRQARALLDDARDERSQMAALDQRLASIDLRLDAARQSLDDALDQRANAAQSEGLAPDVSLRELDAAIRDLSGQRDALSRAIEEMNQRYGELDQRLQTARNDRSFDALKLEYQELQCRLREGKRELVTLLLAKRMLEKSIAAWESRSQPEVYAQASRLLALLTDGAWTRVSMTGEGRLVATALDGTTREVRHLSLGTCQQLYLSLRIAMLLQADSVGASIPVLADDILVNFDAVRRRAAASALAELARKRQVIVFTCHRETATVLQEADNDATYLEL